MTISATFGGIGSAPRAVRIVLRKSWNRHGAIGSVIAASTRNFIA